MMANSFSNPEQTGLFNSSGVSQILASALLATSNSPTTVEFHEEDIIHPEGVENAIGGLRLPLMGEEHAISPEVKDFIRRLYSYVSVAHLFIVNC
jgi:hypothetical protein